MRHVCWMTANSNPGWRYLLMMGFTGYRPLPDRPIRWAKFLSRMKIASCWTSVFAVCGTPENYADQPWARTRRVIGNVMLQQGENAAIIARSNFTLAEIQNDEQRWFAGDYVHTLLPAGESFRISLKRVNLLNCDAPMGGIVIPF